MVQLGSLTIDGIQPWVDILHPSRHIPPLYIHEAVDAKIRESVKKATNAKFKTFLTKVLKFAISSEDTQEARVEAARRIIRYLGNHEQAFDFLTDEATAGDSVREWLQKRVSRRQDILMIVRTDTFVNANVLSGHVINHSMESDASFSPSQAIPGLSALGDVAGVGVTFEAKREREVSDRFHAVGDRIYAVEYRKVSWTWLKQAQDRLDAVGKIFRSLQPTPWTRGGGAEEEKMEGVLMMVEHEGPRFTEEELEDEDMESCIEIEGEDEVEYIFDVEPGDEPEEGSD